MFAVLRENLAEGADSFYCVTLHAENGMPAYADVALDAENAEEARAEAARRWPEVRWQDPDPDADGDVIAVGR